MKYALYIVPAVMAAAVAYVIIRHMVMRGMERSFAAFQHDTFARHYDEVQQVYLNIRGWRHDYHNHIQTLKAHLTLNQTEALGAYLDDLERDLSSVDTLVKSGNLMLDAIINSKVSLAASKGIRLNAKADAPGELTARQVDLCVIIGNLLDNAIEACARVEDPAGRFIRLYIGAFKSQLYISVQNAMAVAPRKSGAQYLTTKDKSHGFGIRRVDAVVKKYGGYVNRQHEEGVFATEVLLPL